MESLDAWIDREYRYAAAAMLKSISRVDLVKNRPGFGHAIRPVKGSIIASPVMADWNPDPDYFFHWYRDSAVIIDALRVLHEARDLGAEALEHFKDFVRFSLSLQALDGRTLIASSAWRTKVVADFVRYLRTDDELALVHGDSVAADTRINPDGTLDISSWTRPQHDGSPLRALAVLRWLQSVRLEPDVIKEATALLRLDLAFTYKFWREPSYDMWEEEKGLHYHTLCVSAAALKAGAGWLDDRELAALYAAEAETIYRKLDEFWLEEAGFYRSRFLSSGQSAKELDISVVFAPIHALGEGGTHSVRDPRIHATLKKLEALFDRLYAINQNRPAQRGVAMGRYAGDRYFSGGPYYFSTLGAAELCFRAGLPGGDAFLETVRAFTPADGQLSEQFDQNTGEQTSAKHLAWSYAAFITCIAARRKSSP